MISVDGILLQNKLRFQTLKYKKLYVNSVCLDFETFSFEITYRANLGETSAVL